MSIPKSVVEVTLRHKDALYHPEYRARLVILALAEELPESAVEKALEAHWLDRGNSSSKMRAALVAALKDIVEGE